MNQKWWQYAGGFGVFVILVGRIWHLRWQQSVLWDQLLSQYSVEDRIKARLNSSSVVSFLQDGGINVSQAQFAEWFESVDDEHDGFDFKELLEVSDAFEDFHGMRGNLKSVGALDNHWMLGISAHMDLALTIGTAMIIFWLVYKLEDLQRAINRNSLVAGIRAARLQSRWQQSIARAEDAKAQQALMAERIKALKMQHDEAVHQFNEQHTETLNQLDEVQRASSKERAELASESQSLRNQKQELEDAFERSQNELRDTRARMKEHVDQATASVKKQLLAMQRCIRGVDAFKGIGQQVYQDIGSRRGFAVSHASLSARRSSSRILERKNSLCSREGSNGHSMGFQVESNMIFGHLTEAGVQFFEVDRHHGLLGKGADCAYKCKDIATNEEYALKIYDIEDDQHSRQVLADLHVKRHLKDHQNIVRYLHVIEAEKQLFVLMELIPGVDLFTYVRRPVTNEETSPSARSHCLKESTAACVFAQVCVALEYVHSCDVIHGDIKPENIMVVEPDKEAPHVKLIDFGFSSFVHFDGEDDRPCVDAYSPPEAKSDPPGTVVKESDLYRLGGTLYFMLTGSTFSRYAFSRGLNLGSLSSEAREVMSALLKEKPEDRMPLEEVLRHPWVQPWV